MSPRINRDQQCQVMGCTLPYMHSGMHISILSGKRKRSCMVIQNATHHCNDVTNEKTATITNSPSCSRNDTLVHTVDTEIQVLKSRLLFLQSTIEDLLRTI
jgi:hypothetical protein